MIEKITPQEPQSMAGQSPQEEILRRQVHGLPAAAGDKSPSLLSFASTVEKVILVVSASSSIIAGALNPLLTVIFGRVTASFQDYVNGNTTADDFITTVVKDDLYFVYLGIALFVFNYIATVGFYYVGERVVTRLRQAYLQSILRQNMAYFDTLGAGEVTEHITADMNMIQEGITSKVSLGLTATATFCSSYVIAYVMYWKLALIMTSTIIVMLNVDTLGGKKALKHFKESKKSQGLASNVAEESIGSMKHVSAFGIQSALAAQYRTFLKHGEKPGIIGRVWVSFMIAFMNGLPYLSYALCFWQGGRYVTSGETTASSVVTTTMAIVIGGFAIGRVAPNFQSFMASVASARTITDSMRRNSPIDALSPEGERPGAVEGELQLNNVSLTYPSRNNVEVLSNVSFKIPQKRTTAIVGPTGSGKSSLVGLLERFYEPTAGFITLDGLNIEKLNIRWLRSQIAYVGQEPVLFNTTIFQNIRHGLAYMSGELPALELEEMVTRAAKAANAHQFILALDNGYKTLVGEKGLQLSGGQRQRIALARALIRDPKILILDEATSALDSQAEHAVQAALDTASQGRTTIVIAHRLATIRHADNIIVLSDGGVVEQGNHDSLMLNEGLYATLVNMQEIVDEPAQRRQAGAKSEADSADKGSVQEAPTSQSFGLPLAAGDPPSKATMTPLSFWELGALMRRLNGPERRLILAGLLMCIIAGLGTPVQSVFFAELINAISLPTLLYGELHSRIRFWALMYFMLGIVVMSAWFLQGYCFAISSERLIRRAKDITLQSILRQDVSFFDERSIGDLTILLSQDTAHLGGLDGAVLGSIFTFITTVLSVTVLSLVVGWKLALVCISLMPFTIGSGWVRLMILSLFDRKVRQIQAESTAYANEAVNAIRTVASLSMEHHVLQHYHAVLDRDAEASLRSILHASVWFSLSQSLVNHCAALVFWYGSTLVASGEYSQLQFFVVFNALITGSQYAGAVFTFAPDMSKALQAGKHLKLLFDRVPAIDVEDPKGSILSSCQGSIDLEQVDFRYPTRPERLIFAALSVSISPCQFIALVGPSGSGKSTVLALLERFFDPEAGRVLVDGQDISTLNISYYRRQIALVGQDATVYSGTLLENIVLGMPNDTSLDTVSQVCKDANIYDFIMSLPNGFATVVGARGSMLSGGQKQRLSIARALLRDPKILLLDEATSSLDSQSERLVQEALNRAAKGRTTVAIAHRLSTIQQADIIYVLDGGVIVEKGTHEQLMGNRNIYFDLVRLQNVNN